MAKKLKRRQVVGILGYGEIGSAIAKICRESGFKVFIKELAHDELRGKTVDYLHINIPEKLNIKFIDIVVKNVRELKPRLTIINSSVTPGTTREIYKTTRRPIVHSPVIGLHPHLYDSIKYHFPKIIGPVNKESLKLAKKHLKDLGLLVEVYDSSEDSETAKLLDLVYYAWNIVFCKWMAKVCRELDLNFEQVYTLHNQIYNQGYIKITPRFVRPILIPAPGPIGGHCVIPDIVLFHKYYKSELTTFILNKNEEFKKEVKDSEKEREKFIKLRDKLIKNK